MSVFPGRSQFKIQCPNVISIYGINDVLMDQITGLINRIRNIVSLADDIDLLLGLPLSIMNCESSTPIYNSPAKETFYAPTKAADAV